MSKNEMTVPDVYTGMDKDVKGQLVYLAAEIKKVTKTATESFLELCSLFAQAHAEFSGSGCEGKFKDWVETKCGVSRRTAYNYLQVHQRWGSVQPVAHLSPITLIQLSQKSVPESAVEEVIETAKSGKVSKTDAEEIIKRHKQVEPEPEPADEWEPVCEQSGPSDVRQVVEQRKQQPVEFSGDGKDPVVERAKGQVPELVRRLRLALGNIGLGGRFDDPLDQIVEAAR